MVIINPLALRYISHISSGNAPSKLHGHGNDCTLSRRQGPQDSEDQGDPTLPQ